MITLFNEKEVNCLARVIYSEARGEPIKGQMAVAIVTVNRTRHNNFPNDICSVIYQPGQYSDIRRLRVKNKESWQRAKNIAYHVLNDYDNLKSFKALYFHNTSVSPNWKRKRIAKIGNHVFYA